MTYTYSWERTSTLSPLDFITEQNNIWEQDLEIDPMAEFEDLAPDFDPDEILQPLVSGQ